MHPLSVSTAYEWWQDLEAPDFRWNIPGTFNIAEACTDLQPTEAPALIVDSGTSGVTYSFSQLGALSRKFMGLLQLWGLGQGDRVAIMVPQGVEVLTAHLGSFRGGFVTVPLSVKFGAAAVAYRLQHSGAKVLVIDAECYDRVKDALPDAPALAHIVVVGRLLERDIDTIPASTTTPRRWSPKPSPATSRILVRPPRPSSSIPRGPPVTPRVPSTGIRYCWRICPA